MSNLDDFFAKKDKKKPGKKAESAVKATELFKVLDSAAQNVQWDDQDSDGGRGRKEISAVLADVLNPEEASKWADPIEEERQYDLSNLKIESLQSADEYDANNAAASADPLKPTKTWDIPKKKDTSAKPDEKVLGKSPVNDNQMDKGKPHEAEEPKQVLASGDTAAAAENVGGEPKKSESEDKHEKPASDSSAYVLPHLRNKAPESAPASSAPAPKDSTAKGSSTEAAYVPPHMRNQPKELQKTTIFGPSSSGTPSALPNKKPELDSEQDFPTLGGPAPKRK